MGALLLGLSGAQAQPAPKFEVASLKISPPRTGTARFTGINADPSLVRYSNITLKLLIAIAYGFDDSHVAGAPAWADKEAYDLVAKLPPDSSKDKVPAMLQALLAERMGLAVHRESKEQKVYFLVQGTGGANLKPTTDSGRSQMMRGNISGTMPLSTVAGMLSRFLGTEVVDHTGLAGLFDIRLTWTPEKGDDNSVGLIPALQEQLGLKLEPGKSKVETLVVDHAERVPVEN